MRYRIPAIALACLLGAGAPATAQEGPFLTRVTPASDSLAAREILLRSRAWHDAIMRGDTAFLSTLLLPEYALTIAPTLEGPQLVREQWLATVQRYQMHADRWEASDVHVRGDVAVVVSRLWQHATPGGRDRSGYFIVTDLWRRDRGEWRVSSRFSVWLDDPRGPHGALADADSDEAAVRALDARWANAYASHDTAFARQLMADDFVMTSTNGSMTDRAAELRDVAGNPALQPHHGRSSDVDVRLHGDAAVVTGLLERSFTAEGGSTTSVARRYTAMYDRGGPLGWRMIALHVGQASP